MINMMLLMIIFLIYLLILLLVLYYLSMIKNIKNCNDNTYINNWRYNVLYLTTILQLVCVLLSPLIAYKYIKNRNKLTRNIKLIYMLILVTFNIGYIYIFLNYIDMNNQNNLECIKNVYSLYTIHTFFNKWKYILTTIFIVTFLLILYNIQIYSSSILKNINSIFNLIS